MPNSAKELQLKPLMSLGPWNWLLEGTMEIECHSNVIWCLGKFIPVLRSHLIEMSRCYLSPKIIDLPTLKTTCASLPYILQYQALWRTQHKRSPIVRLKIIYTILLFCKDFMYLFERGRERGEREYDSEGGRGTGRLHWAWNLTWGLDPTTPRSGPKPKSRVGCQTDWASQASRHVTIFVQWIQWTGGTSCFGIA